MLLRRAVIDFLRAAGPGHCYAGAMSPPAAQQVLSALRVMRGQDGTTRGADKIAALHANSNYLRERLLDLGCNVLGEWNSPVMVRPGWLPLLHAFPVPHAACGPPAAVARGWGAQLVACFLSCCAACKHTVDDPEQVAFCNSPA